MDEAFKHYDLACRNDPSDGLYLYNRGQVRQRLGKINDAISDFTKSLEYLTEADYIYQARFNRGVCYRKLGEEWLDKSIEDLKKAVDMKNEKPSA